MVQLGEDGEYVKGGEAGSGQWTEVVEEAGSGKS